MQFKTLIAAAVMAVAALNVDAVAQDLMSDPIKRAVMESYQEMLAKDPTDYAVYFRRANEYYNHDMYIKALSDINDALKYAPDKEKDLRVQCFALRGAIHERMDMRAEAVNDFGEAIKLDPNNYPLVYQRANIQYQMGNYKGAREDYLKLQRINTRSQEALFGLARCAAMEGDRTTAYRLIDEAVELTPTAGDAYYHRGSVRTLMGDHSDAVSDYIMALKFTKDADLTKPLRSLIEISDVDYNAVINGLSKAIARDSQGGRLIFIRGVIAQEHYRYADAIADYRALLDGDVYSFPGLYRRASECYYALGRYEDAASYIDYAIGSTSDNMDAYVVKSNIKRALGLPSQGISACDRALQYAPNYAPALLSKGLDQIAYKLDVEGSNSVGKASLAEPGEPYYKMVRAWVLNDVMGDTESANKYYFDVLNLKSYAPDDVLSFRGFAMLFTGNPDEGDAWMEEVLKKAANSTDGQIEYFGACYYSARGNMTKALACMEASLAKGYANYHNWMNNNEAGINVAPLRTAAGFNELMTRYSAIFNAAR